MRRGEGGVSDLLLGNVHSINLYIDCVSKVIKSKIKKFTLYRK